MRRLLSLTLLLLTTTVPAAAVEVPISLKGSPGSMVRQSEVAKEAGYPHVKTPHELTQLVNEGALVALTGNGDYTFREGMASGAARPEMRLFIERLAAQYHAATGERLVVTSLTRPQSRQPGNAHALSVHPAGIAVDLRVSAQRASRQWLESALLSLERQGLLDVTRERWPPHYHVALFPEPYLAHVEQMIGQEALTAALAGPQPEEPRLHAERGEAVQPAKVVAAPAAVDERGRSAWSLLWAIPAMALAVGLVRRKRRP